MLLKKLESFFLLLTFGLFLFSCTVEENKKVEKPTTTSPEYKVSIEILNSGSIEKSRFEFQGTIDGNPIYIPVDSAGIGLQEIKLGSGGLLKIIVRAYSLSTGEMTAYGEAEKEISGNTSFEIKLKSIASEDLFYLTYNNDGTETKSPYYKNESVGECPEPTKDGYTFQGWFTSPNGQGTKLTTNYVMTSDLTVYAYWTANSSDTVYTVTFETNGGTSVSSQTVAANTTINKPVEPTKTDYTFTGWYLDSACSNLVSFPYKVTGNVTLYARWISSGNVVKVTGVKLIQASHTFDSVGSAIDLDYAIEPTNATNKSVSWSSNDSSVATVSGGKVTAVSAGSAKITVTTDDGGYIATCDVTVGNATKALKRLIVEKAASSTESAPAFTATAYYSDGTNEDVTTSATWNSTETTVATVSGGKVTLVEAGKTVISASHTFGGVKKTGAKQTVTVTSQGGGSVVYILSTYDEAAGGANIYGWKNSDKPYGVWPGTKMTKTDDGNAYYSIVNDTSEVAGFNINSVSDNNKKTPDLTMPETDGHWLYYYDTSSSKWTKKEYEGTRVSLPGGSLSAAINSEAVTDPVPPTVTITPAGGNISLSGSIKVTFTDGNDTISSAKVTINGTSYDMGTTATTFTKSVKDLGITTGGTSITVSATVTNGEGTGTASATLTTADTPTVVDTFTWDNVNAYFVLTDRFENGNTSNDNSYNRKNGLSGDENVATFHGGDIKGLTDNMDYFKKLGINAIWITAPYEQAHGWVSGKGHKFPHYAFHGYYTLDWTYMDRNMGTIDEFREFVQTCHENGIRVIMDIVMNHVGYNNQEDMITYNHGKTNVTEHGWLSKTSGCGDSSCVYGGNNCWWANYSVEWTNNLWESWWGPWIRSFAYSSGSEYGGSCGGLPDIKSELSSSVGLAPVLKTKWAQETSSEYDAYKVPSVANVDWNGKSGDWRTDKNVPPVQYQIVWLSSWVREFGIDGFRCDTAKHVEKTYWKQLKVACQAALEAWRKDSSKIDNSGAKDWDESFWMTGECWGWTKGSDDSYYTDGGFDSMINFAFNGGNNWDGNYRTNYPKSSNWEGYLSINSFGDSDNNGNRNNCLTYISSHDTGLTRVGDQKAVGTEFILLPGGVQIYYGDESYREKAYAGCGDGDMMTRGDMNLSTAKSSELVAHWGKVGTFRKFNPAVGAGTGSATKRTYSGAAGESKVAIGISGTSVDVSGLFNDGTTVYNWYDGKSATVSGGKVTSFAGGSTSQPILVSDKNPADYGVTF